MKKIEETKETVKSTEFATTIYRIRQERKLTQKEIGDIIGVSDRTISKWENGTTVPDLCQIRNICKKLEISPSLLIKSEKKLSDDITNLRRRIGKILNYILHNIFLITFILVFMLLLLYFINNYNSIKIYDLKYNSENISFENGYLFKTKVTNILIINDIKINKIKYNPIDTKVKLYTLVNGDKKIIYTSENLNNIYIEENKSGADLLSKDVIESIKQNLYLLIETTDENNNEYNYECQITFKEKYNNNKLLYKSYIKNNSVDTLDFPFDNLIDSQKINNKSTKVMSKNNNNANKLASLGYEYDKENDVYFKVDENTKIEYQVKTKNLVVERKKKSNSKNMIYYANKKLLNLTILNNYGELTVSLKYNVPLNKMECYKGNCENYRGDINYTLKVYREVSTILQ
ncbi:MAG: helix-turn-helix transcriptional regulator [Firmicutes bacterium]|nr:helix-turn-helix transcriptional regulator [Bacillota bacterium]